VEENVQMVEKHVGTALLSTYMRVSGQLSLLSGHEFGILATLRVLAAEGLKIDGVYFDDKYKPYEYIAPRFGLFPEKVAKWQFESVRNAPNDTVLLKTLGKTERLGLRSVQLTHGANLSM
ncbi:MAG: hypothetical protein RSG77_19480, partial [Hafnia sp.]